MPGVGSQPAAVKVTSCLCIACLQILRGLALGPLGGPNTSGSSTYQSALPLWAISRGCANCTVQLERCTLLLPQSDYVALLSAALRGQAWQSGARATAPLMDGISDFSVAGAVDDDCISPRTPGLAFASYTGWGVFATRLTILPESPLDSCYQLPDYQDTLPASCGGRGDDSNEIDSKAIRVGLGVGLGVGVPAVLLLASAVLLMWRRKRLGTSLQQRCVDPCAQQHIPAFPACVLSCAACCSGLCGTGGAATT